VTLGGEIGDDLGPDQPCTPDDDDLHGGTPSCGCVRQVTPRGPAWSGGGGRG
jgi:hypothetical protein